MQSLQDKSEKTQELNVGKGDQNNQGNNQTIIAQQQIQEYIQEKKRIYNHLMNFLEDNDNDDFNDLFYIISQQKQEEPRENLEKFLQLIISIANNHHRNESFFNKIIQIIKYYIDQIKQTFTNFEIFNIFESNKKLLHFLFKEKIITIDNTISNEILTKKEPNGNGYCHFFYPEIKELIDEEKAESIEKELLEKCPNVFDCFEKNVKREKMNLLFVQLFEKIQLMISLVTLIVQIFH